MEDLNQRAQATKTVNARINFYIHLVIYAVVNFGLLVINLTTSTAYLWFTWPLLGWGIGLLFHALAVFVFPMGRSVREQMIVREMKKNAPQTP